MQPHRALQDLRRRDLQDRAGGEINCLDPGGFGAVTITKSITIDCTATMAGMTASTTTGIIINAAGATVNIRGVSITGAPAALPGNFGIRILTASQVTIDNVRIQNFTAVSPNGVGITVLPTSGSVSLNVIHSVITGSGTASSGAAINIAPTVAGAAVVNIRDVDMGNNYRGIVYAGNGTSAGSGTLTVTDSQIYRSTDTAITVTSGANGVPTSLDNLVINNNGTGIVLTGSGVQARLGRSVIMFNGTAVNSSGGAGLQSYKDNRIDFNSNNSTPLPMATPE